ncbi:MAG: hypothetical protein U9P63_03395, partial [Patescibacteria group bacterium]|nr:hypothetical protein [Patescibacteria group bacterium]
EQNLIAEKEDYEIPTTALKIVKVEVLDNDGNYQPLTEKKISDLGGMSVDEYLEDSGMPLKYILVGKYIKLKPKPKAGDVTLASGLRLWVSREVDIFTYTDEAQEPGFAEPFHRLLSLGAAFDFASVKKLSNKNDLRTEIEQLKTQLFEFYGNKNLDSKPRIMPRRESII